MSKLDEKILAAAMEGWIEDQHLRMENYLRNGNTVRAKMVEDEIATAQAGAIPPQVAKKLRLLGVKPGSGDVTVNVPPGELKAQPH